LNPSIDRPRRTFIRPYIIIEQIIIFFFFSLALLRAIKTKLIHCFMNTSAMFDDPIPRITRETDRLIAF